MSVADKIERDRLGRFKLSDVSVILELICEEASLQGAVNDVRELILQLALRGMLTNQYIAEQVSSDDISHASPVADVASEKYALRPIKKSEIPYELPLNWKWFRIGQVLNLINGRAFKPTEWSTSGIPIVRIQNLNNPLAGFNYFEGELPSKFQIDSGNLLISWSGTPGTSFGAFIWARGLAYLNQHIFKAECLSPVFTLDFLRLAINSRLDEMISKAHGGVGLRHITKGKLENICIACPPLPEQRRIVAKVDGLLRLCDELEAKQAEAAKLTERSRRSVLASLTSSRDARELSTAWRRLSDHFEILLDRPETLADLRQAILALAVQGKLVALTQNDEELLCRDTVVGDYLEMQNGYAFKSQWFVNQGVRLIRNANIGHGSLDWSDAASISEERAREYERFRMLEGDIVLTLDRPLISTGLKVARIGKQDLPSLLLQRVARPLFKEGCGLDSNYFYMWLQSPFFIDSIDPGKSNGVPHISTREVERIEFAPPSLPMQRRIVSKMGRLFSLLEKATQLFKTREKTAEYLIDSLIAQILGVEKEETMATENVSKIKSSPIVRTGRLKSAKESVSSAKQMVELFEKEGDQAIPEQLLLASRLTNDIDLFFQLLREARDSGSLTFSQGLNQPIRRVK